MVYDDGVLYQRPRRFIPIWSEDRKPQPDDPQPSGNDDEPTSDDDDAATEGAS